MVQECSRIERLRSRRGGGPCQRAQYDVRVLGTRMSYTILERAKRISGMKKLIPSLGFLGSSPKDLASS